MRNNMDVLISRAAVFSRLPDLIPANILIEFTDVDIDALGAVEETDEYWSVLNQTVTRIQEGGET